jgi:hypothetical protein
MSDHGKVTFEWVNNETSFPGGTTHLNGARLGTPSADSEETSAIGRGTIADVKILYASLILSTALKGGPCRVYVPRAQLCKIEGFPGDCRVEPLSVCTSTRFPRWIRLVRQLEGSL